MPNACACERALARRMRLLMGEGGKETAWDAMVIMERG